MIGEGGVVASYSTTQTRMAQMSSQN
jgi:hypothetical protein